MQRHFANNEVTIPADTELFHGSITVPHRPVCQDVPDIAQEDISLSMPWVLNFFRSSSS